ncbi:MAG: M20/M25/M40 family metallo-hydrolase [Actinobacteria bacterium]|nr:M20/M25/M40 family metallo-hydrolase [Actinomycetota bacterium]
MTLSALERRVLQAVDQEAVVSTTVDLIGFETTARVGAGQPSDETALQHYVGQRAAAAGAAVDTWEPTPQEVPPSRQVPAGLSWAGFPQLLATVPGAGGGPRLLLNGHIDAVSAEPRGMWSVDPYRATVREGRVYGRGAVDMKGGVAAILIALETLHRCGVRLRGDLIVSTVTDEESTSAGGVATVAHGLQADAAIVAEPTGLGIGVACRGSLMPTVRVPGRSGHVTAVQPHWSQGGAVSAAEKAAVVLEAVSRLRQHWHDDPRGRHPLLPPASVVATTITGGQWPVSYAASVDIACHLAYLPGQADADGYGSRVETAFTDWVVRHAATDPWLDAHPPTVSWSVDVPPAECPPNHPVVDILSRTNQDLGRPTGVFGADFWHDGATFSQAAGIPSVVYGPGDVRLAHAIDEFVPIGELTAAAQGLALAAMRFCGVQE